MRPWLFEYVTRSNRRNHIRIVKCNVAYRPSNGNSSHLSYANNYCITIHGIPVQLAYYKWKIQRTEKQKKKTQEQARPWAVKIGGLDD